MSHFKLTRKAYFALAQQLTDEMSASYWDDANLLRFAKEYRKVKAILKSQWEGASEEELSDWRYRSEGE